MIFLGRTRQNLSGLSEVKDSKRDGSGRVNSNTATNTARRGTPGPESARSHKKMDESGDVYYGIPNDDVGHNSDPKRCSVRGCTQFLTDGTNNKMCDICRGRHRIYASTKRARRKLEKAAVANAVAVAHNSGDAVMLIHDSDHTISQGQPVVSPWLSPSAQSLHQVCFFSVKVDTPFACSRVPICTYFLPPMTLWALHAAISE